MMPMNASSDRPYFRSEKLLGYDALRRRLFDLPLEGLGFELVPEPGNTWWVAWRNYYREQVYARTGDRLSRYIILIADNHYRDVPNRVLVRLGEGSWAYPDSGFNSLDLETLVFQRDPARHSLLAGEVGLYGLPAVAELEAVLAQAAQDLFTHAADFLHGRMAEFYALRRQANRERAPFAYVPTPGTDDQLAQQLTQDAARKEALRQMYAHWPNQEE